MRKAKLLSPGISGWKGFLKLVVPHGNQTRHYSRRVIPAGRHTLAGLITGNS